MYVAAPPPPSALPPAPAVAEVADDAALEPVYRVFNGRDHMDSLVPGESGYVTERSPLFRTLRAPQPGTVELRRCFSPRTGDHMFSLDAAHECPRAGYRVEGVLGYVFLHPGPGLQELRRCWNGNDHMTVVDQRECTVNRYQIEGGFWAY